MRSQDARSVAFILVTLTLLCMPHGVAVPDWLAPAWIVIVALLCFAASIVNHNHMHCATFRSPVANGAFEFALTLARGHTASDVIVPHNLNHHAEANREADWIRPQLAGEGLGWLRLARYVCKASFNMGVQRLHSGAPWLPPDKVASARAQRILLWVAILVACLHDPVVFLLFNALPWLAGLVVLVGVNLLQHDGCDERMPFGESRNFTSRVGNWLLFNNGYHTAHHFEPSRHWSELPALHATLRARLPRDDLEVESILGFLWQFGWRRAGAHRRIRA